MRDPRFGAALLAAGMLALSGCGVMGGGKTAKLVCPASFLAPNADKQAVFKPGGTTLKDVRYGVEITSINSRCARAEKGITVDTKLQFELVANDPSVRSGSFEYFVSVVDAQRHILTKKTYAMPFEFDPRQRTMNKADELVETLPLINPATGGNYAIVAGLQLTHAQLEFNRAGNAPPKLSVPAHVSLPARHPANNP